MYVVKCSSLLAQGTVHLFSYTGDENKWNIVLARE